jgi:hypothetical protein
MNNLKCQKFSIKTQLKQFGLNPSEWMLFESLEDNQTKVIFHHKKESSLSLMGFLDFKKIKPQIKALELITL